MRRNIVAYLRDELGVPAAEVEDLTQQLYVQHGTTMAGLVARGAQLDYDHYHSRVHATLDYDRLLRPNGARELLAAMRPGARKHIFTNADAAHTAACLKRLDLEGCFEEIWCFETVQRLDKRPPGAPPGVLCKPDRRCFEAVLAAAGVEARRAVFVDDSPRNCAAAHECGIFSVLVRADGAHAPGADVVVTHVGQLPAVLPALFEEEAPRVEAAAEVGVPIRVPA